jgi:hypothetical protein
MPITVLTSVTASAPASLAARAMAGRSVTLGLSLAHRGRPQAAVAATTAAVASAEWANTSDRDSTFGQERFTSTATTSAGASASAVAAFSNSATLRPQMLATTRAPASTRAGSSSRLHASTPGPCRPTLLSMPAAVSCTRGAGFPGHGSAASDFTTTAPREARST